jgi:hypothetical protein
MGGIPPPPGSVPFSGGPGTAPAPAKAKAKAPAKAKAKAAPPVVAQPITPGALLNKLSTLNKPKNIQVNAPQVSAGQTLANDLQAQKAANATKSANRKAAAAAVVAAEKAAAAAAGVPYVPSLSPRAAAAALAKFNSLPLLQQAFLNRQAALNAKPLTAPPPVLLPNSAAIAAAYTTTWP